MSSWTYKPQPGNSVNHLRGLSYETQQQLTVTTETTSATAQCRLLCSIHNIPVKDSAVEQWIRTILESDFHVDHCQQTEGKSPFVLDV